MATQAGEQAVLDSAAPIATADAQLYQNQMLANQSAQNQAALANGNIRAQTGMAGLNLMEQRRQFDFDAWSGGPQARSEPEPVQCDIGP